MTRRTVSRVAFPTFGELLRTRDTVRFETPDKRAMSLIVDGCLLVSVMSPSSSSCRPVAPLHAGVGLDAEHRFAMPCQRRAIPTAGSAPSWASQALLPPGYEASTLRTETQRTRKCIAGKMPSPMADLRQLVREKAPPSWHCRLGGEAGKSSTSRRVLPRRSADPCSCTRAPGSSFHHRWCTAARARP